MTDRLSVRAVVPWLLVALGYFTTVGIAWLVTGELIPKSTSVVVGSLWMRSANVEELRQAMFPQNKPKQPSHSTSASERP